MPSGDSDRCCDHFRVSHFGRIKKKNFRTTTDPNDISKHIFLVLDFQCRSPKHTHVVPFGSMVTLVYDNQFCRHPGDSSSLQIGVSLYHQTY